MKKLIVLIWILVGFVSSSVEAARVDTMLLIADKNGNGAFTLTNEEPLTYFIESSVSEILVDEYGGINRNKYTAANVAQWNVALSLPKFIIESGRSKSIGVRAICGEQCDFEQDKVYEITFTPKSYSLLGEKDQSTAMNVFVGYAPIFIIPTRNPNVSYTIKNNGNTVEIHNTGNTMIRVMIDQCLGLKQSTCKITYMAISGRKKIFNIPKALRGEKLNLVVVNHNETYLNKFSLERIYSH